ncbi:MAG: hypothetical protein WD770_07450 [Actinomycetota bacterium]
MLALAILGPVVVFLVVLVAAAWMLKLRDQGDRRGLRRLWRVVGYSWGAAMVIAGVWWMVTGHLHPAWIALLTLFGLGEIVVQLLWVGAFASDDD